MKIKIESTNNGIWIGVDGQRRCFATTDVARLQEILQTAMAHQGVWEMTPRPFLKADEHAQTTPGADATD